MISAPSPLSRFQFSPTEQKRREEELVRSAEPVQPADYYYQKRRQKVLGSKGDRKKKQQAPKYTTSSNHNYANQTLDPIFVDDYPRFNSEQFQKVNSRSHSTVDPLNEQYQQRKVEDEWKKYEANWKQFQRNRMKPSKSLKNIEDFYQESPLNSAGRSLAKTKSTKINPEKTATSQKREVHTTKSYVNLERHEAVPESRSVGRGQPSYKKSNTDYGPRYENGRNNGASKYSSYSIKQDQDRFSFGPIRETPTLEQQDSSSFWSTSRHPDASIQGMQGLQNRYTYSSQKYPLQRNKHFKLTLKPCPNDALSGFDDRGASRSSLKYQSKDYSIHTPSRFTLTDTQGYSGYQKYQMPKKDTSQNRDELHSLISELRGQLSYYEQQVQNMERESRYFP